MVHQMLIGWFRPTYADTDNPLDDTAQLIGALRARHEIEIFDARRAHDAVWMDARRPFDIFVHELDDTPAHHFIWPYILHYPGVLLLRRTTVQASRAAALRGEGRAQDAAIESRFDLGQRDRSRAGSMRAVPVSPMLRAPVLASRLCIVPHAAVADALRDHYPGAHVVALPIAMPPQTGAMAAGDRCAFGVVATDDSLDRLTVIQRAFERARASGVEAERVVHADLRQVLARSDVLLALQWPALGAPLRQATAGMAARRAVVVFDTTETADWPSLDPQTWRERRSMTADPPVCVSLDLRDEEHSLLLAVRRLTADARLRERLGAAGEAWWREHHAPGRVVPLFERLLEEARTTPPPPEPPGWPAHLRADGTARAREILSAMDVTVDIF